MKLGVLTPRSLVFLWQAKRMHGNNLCFLLKFTADYYTNKIAVTNGAKKLSFKEFYETVLHVSFTINKKINVQKETTAILVCNNTINDILVLYAIQNLGIKLILVNHKLHSTDINKIITKQTTPYYLFTSDPIHLLIDGAINIDQLVADSATVKKGKLFSKYFARLIFPTSGTTGDAKLIEKRTGEFYWIQSFVDLVERTSIHKRDSVYISIPVSHGFGYTALLFTMILGKKALLPGELKQTDIADLLLNEKADLLVGAPTALFSVAEKLQGTNHNIKSIISGGSSMSEVIFKKLSNNLTKEIFSMYGSTEASVSFIADYNQLNENISALGEPLKGIQYRLETLPEGGQELLIQSGLSNISTTDGWIHMGDIVEEDAHGNLSWRCRKDDMIIKSAVNIYPVEIEKELFKLNDVEDAFVTKQKDLIKGEIIIAFVKMKSLAPFDESIIKNQLKQVLSGIKIPDKIYEIANFEYTNTGKKLKPEFTFSPQ